VTNSSPSQQTSAITFKAKAKKATQEHKQLYLLGKKMIGDSIEAVQDALKQLLTLATALLGGSIAFMSEQIMPTGCKIGLILAFLLTVGISCWGIMPYGWDRFSPHFPQLVQEVREHALAWKIAHLKWAGGCLLLGFCIAVIGLIARAFLPITELIQK
jgi:hypothetical protein